MFTPLLFVVGGDDRTLGITGASGLAVLLVVNGLLAIGRGQAAPNDG